MKVISFSMYAPNRGVDLRFLSPVTASYLFLPELNVVLCREKREEYQDYSCSIIEEGQMLDAAKVISEGGVPDFGIWRSPGGSLPASEHLAYFSDKEEFDYDGLKLMELVELARQKAGLEPKIRGGIEEIFNASS